MDKNQWDLESRLFEFAVDVIVYLRKIKNVPETKVIKHHVLVQRKMEF